MAALRLNRWLEKAEQEKGHVVEVAVQPLAVAGDGGEHGVAEAANVIAGMLGDNLQEGIDRLVEEYRVNTLAEATLIVSNDGLDCLPTPHSTALFHICQEALANAAKHSQARRINVRLWSALDRVLLEVADNGKGFDLPRKSVTLGHGLSNMHIRASKVGGDVEITSAPGEGTTVLAWVPCQSE